MNKIIVVRTNDPDKKKFNLKVTGPIEKVVTVEPASVFLSGKPGQELKTEVAITPSEKYPFKILQMEQHNKLPGIRTALLKPEKEGKPWKIDVDATSKTAANFYDTLTLTTDSKYVPVIRIRISVMFFAPDKQKDS